MGKTFGIIVLCFAVIVASLVFTFALPNGVAFAETQLTLTMNGGFSDNLNIIDDRATVTVDGEYALPTIVKSGYSFLGWTASNDENDTDYYVSITESEASQIPVLYAKFDLDAPVIVKQPSDYNARYDETLYHELSVEIEHPLSNQATIGYVWYKNDATFSHEKSLTLKNVADSGEYRCEIVFEYDGKQKTVVSEPVSISITKAEVSTVEIPTLDGVYSADKTLADYPLPDFFRWVDDNEVPVANKRLYRAIYDKGENYEPLYLNVPLLIEKAKQIISVADISKIYDGNTYSITASATDGDITYSDNNSLTDVGKQLVVITASETDNYLETVAYAYIEILPQTVRVEWFNRSFIYDATEHAPDYSCVSAQNVALTLYIGGKQSDAGVYTATAEIHDNNYVLENASIEFVIEKADVNPDSIAFEPRTVIYDGLSHSITASNLPNFVTAEYDGNYTEAGIYTVTVRFIVDNPNYNDIAPKTAVLTILRDKFVYDNYEIVFHDGIDPSVRADIRQITDLDGLEKRYNDSFDCLYGFRLTFSEQTNYQGKITLRLKYDKIDLNTFVYGVDDDLNVRTLTYTYENGYLCFDVSETDYSFVIVEKTQSLWWIIPFAIVLCSLICVGVYLLMKKGKRS